MYNFVSDCMIWEMWTTYYPPPRSGQNVSMGPHELPIVSFASASRKPLPLVMKQVNATPPVSLVQPRRDLDTMEGGCQLPTLW